MTRRRRTVGDIALSAYEWFSTRAAIHGKTRRAQRFAAFGEGSIICFPPTALYGERAIRIGRDVLIGPHISLSAGMSPTQELISDEIVTIGDHCLIGRQSSIVGHLSITIGDNVFFGPNVYVTDQNHGVDRLDLPIGRQSQPEKPVVIGAGSWIGTNSVVLPGVTIGEHVAVGAGSVVTADVPDKAVVAGVPAKIIRFAGDPPAHDG
ncbi:MAG: acyltransferase [Actinomycetota bacterium]